jgi:hypothetical protein
LQATAARFVASGEGVIFVATHVDVAGNAVIRAERAPAAGME